MRTRSRSPLLDVEARGLAELVAGGMEHMRIVENGSAAVAVFVPKQAGAMERNAAALFVEEVSRKTGATPHVEEFDGPALGLSYLAVAPAGGPAPEIGEMRPEGDEGFQIATTGGGLVLAANTGAGVIYAVDHVLDAMAWGEGSASIPEINLSDSPDCEIRGSSFASLGHPRFMEDPSDLDGMKALVRLYARNRMNLVTVEATGRKWPGDLTPLVSFKLFPRLQDPSREEDIARCRAMMNEFIDYAHSWAVKVVLYTSEFNHQPDVYERCPELMGTLPETWSEGRHNYIRGCMCLSRDITWQYWRSKVVEALEALPGLDGLELWVAEVPSEFGICACDDCRAKTRSQWLERFYNSTREAMDEVAPRMPLIIKTFQSSQGALEVERYMPLKDKLPHDSIICTKGQFGDMAYLNDPHPLLGRIQNGAEIAEFDAGGEYCGGGLGAMVCCIPEHLAERMRLYHSRGVRRFLARHAVPTWPNKEFTDINDLAFSRLAWDMNTDLETLWQSWARERFGQAAAPKMVELLKLSDEVVNKTLYVRRACANRHYYIFPDNIDSLKYMMFDLSAFMIDGSLPLLEPTPENIAAIVAEKEEGIASARRMLAIYEEVAPMLPEEMSGKLGEILRRTERIALVMRRLIEAAFSYMRWERSLSIRERDLLRPRILELVSACEAEVDAASGLTDDRCAGQALWGLRKLVDFDRARRLVEEIRGLVNFRIGQKAEYTVTITPSGVGHPNTYSEHRRDLRKAFGLPGEG